MWGTKSGFTLIELLVTIGLMAVLMAGVVAQFGQGPRQFARDVQRKTDIETIRSALEAYRNDLGYYPGCGGGLGPIGDNCNVTALASDLAPYVGSGVLPGDPLGAAVRWYRYAPTPALCGVAPTRCTAYAVCVGLEQGTGSVACGTGINSTNCGNGVTCNLRVANP